jgi:hypothetical protein
MLRLRMRLCGEILAALLRECTLKGLNAKGVESGSAVVLKLLYSPKKLSWVVGRASVTVGK